MSKLEREQVDVLEEVIEDVMPQGSDISDEKKIANDGSSLNQRYLMHKLLGEGGLGKVYESSDIYDNFFDKERKLAIKIPSSDVTQKKDAAAFVYAEYDILRDINHPNIVKAYDFGIDAQQELPYIVMEYLEGELFSEISLYDLTQKDRKKIVNQIFNTVKYIHSKEVIHADLSPNNIMILPDKSIKVFDFGIAQKNDDNQSFNFSFDRSQAFSMKYAAPEIIKGANPDFASDVFSVGVMIYELYERRLPYDKNALSLEKRGMKSISFCKMPLRLRLWVKQAINTDIDSRIKTFPNKLWF